MSCYSICSDSPGNLTLDECLTLPGRVRGMLLVRCDEYDGLDFTSLAEIQALTAQNKAYLFPKTRGEVGEASASTVDGYGNDDERSVTWTRPFTVEHNEVQANLAFAEVLNNNYDWHVALWIGGTEGASADGFHLISKTTVSWNINPVVDASIDGETKMIYQGSWKGSGSANMWDQSTVPTGLYT